MKKIFNYQDRNPITSYRVTSSEFPRCLQENLHLSFPLPEVFSTSNDEKSFREWVCLEKEYTNEGTSRAVQNWHHQNYKYISTDKQDFQNYILQDKSLFDSIKSNESMSKFLNETTFTEDATIYEIKIHTTFVKVCTVNELKKQLEINKVKE